MAYQDQRRAVATLPFGWLVDRTNRTGVLAITVALWGVVMGLSAAAASYLSLLLTRLALGAMIAVVVPAVASLVGDYFQPHRRGRVYGYIPAADPIIISPMKSLPSIDRMARTYSSMSLESRGDRSSRCCFKVSKS